MDSASSSSDLRTTCANRLRRVSPKGGCASAQVRPPYYRGRLLAHLCGARGPLRKFRVRTGADPQADQKGSHAWTP
jgi:hypothetical protein